MSVRKYKVKIINADENLVEGWVHDDETLELTTDDMLGPMRDKKMTVELMQQLFNASEAMHLSLIRFDKI